MRYESEDQDCFQELVQYFNNLLKRENLCHNTYLYKQMRSPLSFPIYAISEEKTVANITRDYSIINDALKRRGLVQILNGKEVRLIQHPTVKIHISCFAALRQIQRILQEKEKKYEITRRYDTDDYVNLTVLSENSAWLQELVLGVDPKIKYQLADLMEDIRFGVDRIRKLKVEHAKQKTEVGRVKYSINRPPEVFIRKALESSSGSQDQDLLKEIAYGNGKYMNGKNGHRNGKTNGFTNGKHKKYANGNKQKSAIKEEDFPIIE